MVAQSKSPLRTARRVSNAERMADDLAETLEEGVELKITTLEAKTEQANAD